MEQIYKVEAYEYPGGTVVHCHGVFDVLHVGHLRYLEAARKFGDYLIVTVTSDRYVNKGPGRPHFSETIRAQMLSALDCVDYVFISDHSSAVPAIDIIQPDFYVKGPDYKDMSKDATGQIYAEAEAVRVCGGRMVFTDAETYSSSALINRFFAPWSDEQYRVIEEIRALGGVTAIQSVLDKIAAEIKVVVVGECIWDIYRYVRPEGLSSKSPSISARYISEEKYRGGAWAITKHIEDFCPVIQVSSGVEHKKIRYISADTDQRLFEVTELGDEAQLLETMPTGNLTIMADFGHGFFAEPTYPFGAFTALNVQTNSSNYGFNIFRKHKVFDYLVLDTREIRIAYNDRESSAIELGMRAHAEHKVPIGLTLGPFGSAFFQDNQVYLCPAFTDKVVDAIGAGDAYLALTSLLVRTGADPRLIGFLGNVFAGLKTKIIGNKASVTKAQLLKACQAILS